MPSLLFLLEYAPGGPQGVRTISEFSSLQKKCCLTLSSSPARVFAHPLGRVVRHPISVSSESLVCSPEKRSEIFGCGCSRIDVVNDLFPLLFISCHRNPELFSLLLRQLEKEGKRLRPNLFDTESVEESRLEATVELLEIGL